MLSQATAQRIEHWKLSELAPSPRNPRRHSDAQIAQIAGSIAHFGFNSPILIDSKGNIIAGHGRHSAALKLGLETAPVIVLDHLNENDKRAYLGANNKLAELALLLADAELRRIAGHRLICGNCRDRNIVFRLFDGAHANLVICSPPYAAQRDYDASVASHPSCRCSSRLRLEPSLTTSRSRCFISAGTKKSSSVLRPPVKNRAMQWCTRRITLRRRAGQAYRDAARTKSPASRGPAM